MKRPKRPEPKILNEGKELPSELVMGLCMFFFGYAAGTLTTIAYLINKM